MVNFNQLYNGIYQGKKVLVTGHTGFKGSWLSTWLKTMGAEVFGYSLAPEGDLNHISLLELGIDEVYGDLRNIETLNTYISKVQPDIVFHLAAQALVRPSYDDPIGTFSTNVMGTANLLEACRNTKSVKAIVNVTSDKCYENKEWIWGYRENDPMGGYDPYSASKGMMELLTSSYRNSFFHPDQYGKKHHVLLGTGRAGNVIGGGDWAIDRLVPDMMKAASKDSSVLIRNPKATRPWQHVLEPLSGYLLLGAKLLEGNTSFANGWNFGPEMESNLSVGELMKKSALHWEKVVPTYGSNEEEYHEANLLMLDCSKANKIMKWLPVWDIDNTIEKTIHWYKEFYNNRTLNTQKDLEEYIVAAHKKGLEWAK